MISGLTSVNSRQWRSKNSEKITHIKGRQLEQAVTLFNCAPFQNRNFSWRKEFAPRGSEFFPLRAVPYGMENYCYHKRWPPLIVTILMGATPMVLYNFLHILPLTLCMLGNFSCFCCSLLTFFKINFFKNFSRNTFRVSNNLDLDQDQQQKLSLVGKELIHLCLKSFY